jgi:hypothetical protein
MSHADGITQRHAVQATGIAHSLVQRLEAQLGPLGVDVRLHLANVAEMCERNPGLVENPAGLFVTWCQREADAHQARAAAAANDRERYAHLQVAVYAEVASGRFTPRELARVLTQASREGFPALNRRTIELLRAMGNRWEPLPPPATRVEGPDPAAARDARGLELQGTGPGRSDAGAHTRSG